MNHGEIQHIVDRINERMSSLEENISALVQENKALRTMLEAVYIQNAKIVKKLKEQGKELIHD